MKREREIMNESILIKTVRVYGFRALKNIEVQLDHTTVLTGINNSGKTSFLKALQIVFGNRLFLTHDDFFIEGNENVDRIVIDVLIVPTNENGKGDELFSEDWEILFTTSRIKFTEDGKAAYVPLRTVVRFDQITGKINTKQYILEEWVDFVFADNKNWYELDDGKESSFVFEEVPFFYMDAQRDILDDIKAKSSYMGRMLSSVEYDEKDIEKIEKQIEELNATAIEKSEILKTVRDTLNELSTAMDGRGRGVEITPFTKRVRDLSKGLTINYGDDERAFSMEYHGMGTRSWSSILTLKAFIELFRKNSEKENKLYFPIMALEEPEAHLHPNAQKRLYTQISSFVGQKIISTHSPYVAESAHLEEIRSFYKKADNIECGQININELKPEWKRKIERQVVHSRGEILFSKCLVLGEGETEEQALPVFFEKYFGYSHVEAGVDFVGVEGYKNYRPFLNFASGLNIPWVIFSDNDHGGTVKKEVEKQVNVIGSELLTNIIFLSEGNDFEKELIQNGYDEEIKKAILNAKEYANENHRNAKEEKDRGEIYSLDAKVLHEELSSNKTKYAPRVAEEIVNSGKDLPSKVIELFEKIKEILQLEVRNA